MSGLKQLDEQNAHLLQVLEEQDAGTFLQSSRYSPVVNSDVKKFVKRVRRKSRSVMRAAGFGASAAFITLMVASFSLLDGFAALAAVLGSGGALGGAWWYVYRKFNLTALSKRFSVLRKQKDINVRRFVRWMQLQYGLDVSSLPSQKLIFLSQPWRWSPHVFSESNFVLDGKTYHLSPIYGRLTVSERSSQALPTMQQEVESVTGWKLWSSAELNQLKHILQKLQVLSEGALLTVEAQHSMSRVQSDVLQLASLRKQMQLSASDSESKKLKNSSLGSLVVLAGEIDEVADSATYQISRQSSIHERWIKSRGQKSRKPFTLS